MNSLTPVGLTFLHEAWFGLVHSVFLWIVTYYYPSMLKTHKNNNISNKFFFNLITMPLTRTKRARKKLRTSIHKWNWHHWQIIKWRVWFNKSTALTPIYIYLPLRSIKMANGNRRGAEIKPHTMIATTTAAAAAANITTDIDTGAVRSSAFST